MHLTVSTLLVYGILAINYSPSLAVKCYSCASRILRENWEATGLPSHPENGSFFSSEDCENPKERDEVDCINGCFFAAYALASHEYVVVRGCVEGFSGDTGITIDAGSFSCETARSNNLVYTRDKTDPIPNPVVGWYVCNDKDCNATPGTGHTAEDTKNWGTREMNCKEPTETGQCIECQHFDGEGRCHYNSKSLCEGHFCTKLTGKLNGRWFEIRGCTPLAPMGKEVCISYDKNVIVEQLGSTINQTYWSTSCVCRGSRCNSSMRSVISISTLILSIFLFNAML